jgi:hypothetical protein
MLPTPPHSIVQKRTEAIFESPLVPDIKIRVGGVSGGYYVPIVHSIRYQRYSTVMLLYAMSPPNQTVRR